MQDPTLNLPAGNPALPETLNALTPETRTVLEGLFQLQTDNQRTLQRQLLEFGKLLLAMDDQNRRLQKLVETRVTITVAQARALTREIADHARQLCRDNKLDYRACGRRYRTAIRRDVLRAYAIAAIGDLPAAAQSDAWDMVADWDSYKLARELRTSGMGGETHA